MDYNEIRSKFVKRMSQAIDRYRQYDLSAVPGKRIKIGDIPEFRNEITTIFNDLMSEHGIDPHGMEQEEILEFIKPTLEKILSAYITDDT